MTHTGYNPIAMPAPETRFVPLCPDVSSAESEGASPEEAGSEQ
jgi:hypothetical protein